MTALATDETPVRECCHRLRLVARDMCADGFFGSAQRKHKRRSPRNRVETVLPY